MISAGTCPHPLASLPESQEVPVYPVSPGWGYCPTVLLLKDTLCTQEPRNWPSLPTGQQSPSKAPDLQDSEASHQTQTTHQKAYISPKSGLTHKGLGPSPCRLTQILGVKLGPCCQRPWDSALPSRGPALVLRSPPLPWHCPPAG